MNDDQHARLRSYTAVETVLNAHPAPLDTIPAAQDAIILFRDRLQALRDAAQAQETYTPRSTQKRARREALADAAVAIAQPVAAYASVKGDLTLAAQMDLTRTDFTRAREQDTLERARLVHATATLHAADLDDYGVTPALLANLDALTTAFADTLGTPRHAIAERKAHTEAIETLFAQIDDVLTKRLDRLVVRFKGTPFYAEYQAARRIVGP